MTFPAKKMILNLIKSPSRRTSDRERLMNICARIPGAGLARSAVIIILAATGGRLGTHAAPRRRTQSRGPASVTPPFCWIFTTCPHERRLYVPLMPAIGELCATSISTMEAFHFRNVKLLIFSRKVKYQPLYCPSAGQP